MANPADPFSELTRLFERMQEDFEEMARRWDGGQFGMTPTESSSMRVDLENKTEEFVLTAELPGFDKDDIDVRVTDQTLRIEAEREAESEEETEGEYVRRERHRASVSRSIRLPEAVEADDVSATYNNGILTVRIPKSEPVSQGTRIEVK